MSTASHLAELTEKIAAGNSLSYSEAVEAAQAMPQAEIGAEPKKAFLLALAEKGESPEEVAAFAQTFRALARDPGLGTLAEGAIDVVGTGGDKSGSFNISSVTAFLLAASGARVLKHGNRSITSKCGSAQIIERAGINIEAEDSLLKQMVETLGFTFFFAPAFHPAFKEIMPVRQQLAAAGKRTIFNILGPLINPAKPTHQLMGVFSPQWVSPLAQALDQIGLRRGLVVHCDLGEGFGMDELSVAGKNLVAGFGSLKGYEAHWTAEDLGLEPCSTEALKGGDVEENWKILENLADGKVSLGLESTITLNLGAALFILERADSIEEAILEAQSIIRSDALKKWLVMVREFSAV